MSLSRRKFNKTILTAGMSLPVSPAMWGNVDLLSSKSQVAFVKTRELIRKDHDIPKMVAARYLAETMTAITGKPHSQSAWQSLFEPGERVGIKLSCLPGNPLSSSRGLVMATVDGLVSAGVKRENIYIWERTGRELEKAGFKLGRTGVNILGTDQFRGSGYSRNLEIVRSVGTFFSLIMEQVDALINIPVLKDHDIAGVSIGMKNFYGAIQNPNKYHRDNCNPYVADLNTHPLIKNKLRLIICDASRMQVHNGPAFFPRYAVDYGGLLVSRDPVALDYTGWQIIEDNRKTIGLKSLTQENREPKYIFQAARLELGWADPKKINVINIKP